MARLWADARYGLRSLLKTPGFTLVAITALAIGIGANVTIFGFANAFLLKPMAIGEPERAIRAYAGTASNVSYADYVRYRDQNRSLQALAEFDADSGVTFRADGPAENVSDAIVTGNYFQAVAVPAALGRTITQEDDQHGAPGVVMLSDRFWHRRFGGDPQVVGRSVFINGNPYTIVGITPAWFTGTLAPLLPSVYVPWNGPGLVLPGAGHLIGRLQPGVTIAQAQADLTTIAKDLRIQPDREIPITVYPATTILAFGAAPVQAFFGVLMGIVGLVLLITCVNIASLLLARSSARRREVGIRLALGAKRTDIIRQFLIENLMLSALGGLGAVFIGLITGRAILSVPLPVPVDVALSFVFDWRAILFTLLTTFGTSIVFGLIPAIQSARADVAHALKETALASDARRSRLRAGFVVTQVALSTLLLVTAGLLVRSLTSPSANNRGFTTERVLSASINLRNAGYTRETGAGFYRDLLERLQSSPGIVSASIVDTVPLSLSDTAVGMRTDGQERPTRVSQNRVSPGYFRTLDIPLLEGRDFTNSDRAGSPQVAIVNETLARKFWPGESPIGKRLRQGDGPWIEIVGMARDSKYQWIGEDATSFLYAPIVQNYFAWTATILIKTTSAPASALPILRANVEALDRNVPVFSINTLEDVAGLSLLPVRFAAVFAGSLGLVALALGAIGIYGVMACLVRQRTREIGIRIALGARPSSVVQLMTRQAMGWTAMGLGLGLVSALAVSRLITSLLYGVATSDPITFIGISVILSATAFAACYLPARRASQIDPLTALRNE